MTYWQNKTEHLETQIRELKELAESPKQRHLAAYLSERMGGETPGDTLIRFASLVRTVETEKGSAVDISDWRSWLEDLGNRLNSAADSPLTPARKEREPTMKLAFTFCDASHMVHTGADLERETHVIDVPDAFIPMAVIEYVEGIEDERKRKQLAYQTLSISYVRRPDAVIDRS